MTKKLDLNTVIKKHDLILDRYEDYSPDSENEFKKIIKSIASVTIFQSIF